MRQSKSLYHLYWWLWLDCVHRETHMNSEKYTVSINRKGLMHTIRGHLCSHRVCSITQGSFENGNKIGEADFISSTWNRMRTSAITFVPSCFRESFVSFCPVQILGESCLVFVCGIHSISLIRFECYVLYNSNGALVAIRIANVDVARLDTNLWIAWNRIAFLFHVFHVAPTSRPQSINSIAYFVFNL